MLVSSVFPAIQHICMLFIFWFCYTSLLNCSYHTLASVLVIAIAAAVPVVVTRLNRAGTTASTLVYIGILVAVSPVLNTLTDAVSTNTVHLAAVVLLGCNTLTEEYSTKKSSAVALNAGMFAAVLLASRLPSSLHALVLLAIALATLHIWPSVRSVHIATSATLDTLLTAATVTAATTASFLVEDFELLGPLVVALVAVGILYPLWLLWLQRFKSEIRGPWDEAVPG